MCGIVGYVDLSLYRQDLQVFDDYIINSLILDTIRGWDSTGVVFVEGKGNVEIYKRALAGFDFVGTNRFCNMMKRQHGLDAFIGHNRAATVGKVKDESAHPFVRDHITLVHNGTLDWNDSGLDEPAEIVVDSDAIAWAMSVDEPEEVLPKIQGAYALVWHDSRDNSINFARNNERPLWLVHNTNKSVMFFGSEKETVLGSLNNHVTGECRISNLSEPYKLKPGRWLKIKLDVVEDKQFEITEFTPAVKKPLPTTTPTSTTIASKTNGGTGTGGGCKTTVDQTTKDICKKANILPNTRILFTKENCVVRANDNRVTMYGRLATTSEHGPDSPPRIVSYDVDKDIAWGKDKQEILEAQEKAPVFSGIVERAWLSTTQAGTPLIRVSDVDREGTWEEFCAGDLDWIDENFYDFEEDDDDDVDVEVITDYEDVDFVVLKDGTSMDINAFIRLASVGCGNCERSLTDVPAKDIRFYGPDCPICPDCHDTVFGDEDENKAIN